MTKFVDIYLRVTKAKTLRDEIAAEELPVDIQEDLQYKTVIRDITVSVMRLDKERALERLSKIKDQLAAARRFN